MKFIYWSWESGGYSRVHKVHPQHSGLTWCGAVARPSVAGVETVRDYYRGAGWLPPELEGCVECLTRPNPVNVSNPTASTTLPVS